MVWEYIPEDDPTFINDKFYCVHLALFKDVTPATDCSQTPVGDRHCCHAGVVFNLWLAAGNECDSNSQVCGPSDGTAQKILDFTGPFDTLVACELVCGL